MTMNQVVLDGTLLEAAEFRHTPAGTAVAQFQVEHHADITDLPPLAQLSCRLTVVALGPLAEECRGRFPGVRVRVHGVLNQKQWLRGGVTRWGGLELVARALQWLPTPDETDASRDFPAP